jgi:hypothetical protein
MAIPVVGEAASNRKRIIIVVIPAYYLVGTSGDIEAKGGAELSHRALEMGQRFLKTKFPTVAPSSTPEPARNAQACA